MDSDKQGGLAVAFVIIVIIAYCVGVSSGKKQAEDSMVYPEHTDDEYNALYNCAESLNNQRLGSAEKSSISLDLSPVYDEMDQALSEIHSDTNNIDGDCPFEP